MRCGFSGGVVVDYPNSAKAKKYFLVIDAGVDQTARLMPVALGCEGSVGGGGGAGKFSHGKHIRVDERRKGGNGVSITVICLYWITAVCGVGLICLQA